MSVWIRDEVLSGYSIDIVPLVTGMERSEALAFEKELICAMSESGNLLNCWGVPGWKPALSYAQSNGGLDIQCLSVSEIEARVAEIKRISAICPTYGARRAERP